MQQRSAFHSLVLGALVGASVLAIPSGIIANDEESAGEVLQKMIANQDKFQAISYTLDTKITTNSPGTSSKKQANRFNIIRLDSRVSISGEHDYLDANEDQSYKIKIVANDGRVIHTQHVKTAERPKSGMVVKKQYDDNLNNTISLPEYGGCLFGNTMDIGDHSLAKSILTCADRRRLPDEKINGSICKVVEAKTNHGTLTAWVCPSLNYICLKFSVKKAGRDIYEGKPLNQARPYSPTGNAKDASPITGYEESYQVASTKELQGGAIATKAEYTYAIRRVKGPVIRSVYDFTVTDIAPVDATILGSAAFKTNLAAGALVNFRDEENSGLMYKWNGTDVELYNNTMEVGPDNFVKNESNVKLLLILNGIGILLISVWLLARRYRKKANYLLLFALIDLPQDSVASEKSQVFNYTTPYCGLQSVYRTARCLNAEVDYTELLNKQYLSSKSGSSLAELNNACEHLRLHTLPLHHGTSSTLKGLNSPAILHVKSIRGLEDFDHWVVFLGSQGDVVRLGDGNGPVQTLTFADLNELWDGNGLIVSREPISPIPIYRDALLFYSCCIIYFLIMFRVVTITFQTISGGSGPTKSAALNVLAKELFLVLTMTLATIITVRIFMPSSTLSNDQSVEAIQSSYIFESFRYTSYKQFATAARDHSATIIDARFPADYKAGTVPGAINIPIDLSPGEVAKRLANIQKDGPILIFCQSSGCPYSKIVGQHLLSSGYDNLTLYKDGWLGWEANRDTD